MKIDYAKLMREEYERQDSIRKEQEKRYLQEGEWTKQLIKNYPNLFKKKKLIARPKNQFSKSMKVDESRTIRQEI